MTLERRCDSDKPAVFSFHFARRFLPVAVTRIVFPFFCPRQKCPIHPVNVFRQGRKSLT